MVDFCHNSLLNSNHIEVSHIHVNTKMTSNEGFHKKLVSVTQCIIHDHTNVFIGVWVSLTSIPPRYSYMVWPVVLTRRDLDRIVCVRH